MSFRLPDFCATHLYVGVPFRRIKVIIQRGVAGHYRVPRHFDVEKFNKKRKITEAQITAMVVGCLFGWGVPGAKPNYWQNLLNERG